MALNPTRPTLAGNSPRFSDGEFLGVRDEHELPVGDVSIGWTPRVRSTLQQRGQLTLV